ncbi:class I SAM-dependent methyltransferase [Reinekea marinisedimentorum]|uniref:2-polyprenyl-3-methyl-5-hydroxy-6-metoxy-1, 4-benzoquinol methylase n=1 Tax=Reinekea marinisedimentorum TaxID=230495 RepID=A0A4R3HQP8_9GAMM|nr:class I SAM-dependent methyltransferase [Reinekea marinisedimentorum]TCS35085.1 2-polyprenyl-3-methyl-5-hydroxy-6-metoxy-1,4-benzoquinol methylase [Reinekea marinisedimentorum]
MSELEFYNKQFEKYGRYDHGTQESKKLDLSNPEDYFENLIHSISSKEKTLVDLGCGDGLFTSTLASLNKRVIGVEPSNLINVAYETAKNCATENLTFVRENAVDLGFDDSTIDIVISRRGPNPADEIARILSSGGMFAFITIGEQDCRELKKLVGRGQHFGDSSRVKEELVNLFQGQGFEIIECQDFCYSEKYESESSLIEFLHQVPIFDGFDRDDYSEVSKYCTGFERNEIQLNRHRVVLLAKLSS